MVNHFLINGLVKKNILKLTCIYIKQEEEREDFITSFFFLYFLLKFGWKVFTFKTCILFVRVAIFFKNYNSYIKLEISLLYVSIIVD